MMPHRHRGSLAPPQASRVPLAVAAMMAAMMAVVLVPPAAATDGTTAPQCHYDGIQPPATPFNPWDRWNVYGFAWAWISESIVQGRVAADVVDNQSGSQIYTKPQTFEPTEFAVTSVNFVNGPGSGSVVNGDVEAYTKIQLTGGTIHGDAVVVDGAVEYSAATTVDGQIKAKANELTVVNNAPNPPTEKYVQDSTLALSVGSLSPIDSYLFALSVTYEGMPQTVVPSIEGTEIHVTLSARLNVVNDITTTQLDTATKIVLKGAPNSAVIFNILDAAETNIQLDELPVVYESADETQSPPTFNRVLLHITQANAYFGPDAGFWAGHGMLRVQGSRGNHTLMGEMMESARKQANPTTAAKARAAQKATDEKPVFYFSVLAPNSWAGVGGAILKGNLFAAYAGVMAEAEVHTMPWGRVLKLSSKGKGTGNGPYRPRAPKTRVVTHKCLWGNI